METLKNRREAFALIKANDFLKIFNGVLSVS